MQGIATAFAVASAASSSRSRHTMRHVDVTPVLPRAVHCTKRLQQAHTRPM